MMKKISLSDHDLSAITASIEKYKLTTSSHLYKRYAGKSIGEAAGEFFGHYSNEANSILIMILII